MFIYPEIHLPPPEINLSPPGLHLPPPRKRGSNCTYITTAAIRTKSRGAILISNIERAKYVTKQHEIIPSVREVLDETIILQFQEYLVRLEHVARNKKNADLDTKDFIKLICAVTKGCTEEFR